MEKSAIFGKYPRLVPVPNRGGTDTHSQKQSGTGTNQSGTSTHSQKRVGISTDL